MKLNKKIIREYKFTQSELRERLGIRGIIIDAGVERFIVLGQEDAAPIYLKTETRAKPPKESQHEHSKH